MSSLEASSACHRQLWKERHIRRRTVRCFGLAVGLVASSRHLQIPSPSGAASIDLELVAGDADVSLLVSKALSVAVIVGSCVGKLPQVYTVWRAGSAEGISMISVWTEAVSMGVQFAYNTVRGMPVTTYAEVAIIFPQMLLLALVAAWADGYLSVRVWLACFVTCAGAAMMALGIVSPVLTTAAYTANALFGFVAVIPQVVVNYKNKSTGQLNFFVTAMGFGGISMRLFTTFVEVDDVRVRVTMMVNWTLVMTLMLQFAMFRDSRPLPAKPSEPDLATSAIKKSNSTLQVLSAIGSSRCLSDMIDKEVVDTTMQVIKSRSSASLSHITGSMSFGALPYVSHSVPELSELRSAQATVGAVLPLTGRHEASPSLRRN
eukprot:TRINITY_DN63674_c0_g1_i1.p1 TRINITY_DN63674_c0_g1~~TRINITY_DN63674_c0_g1_i1.p1  ORF type:complete len:375 (-),score=39.01 TRINITY_DN63674_c0_g1_i1:121-1245(-)